MSVSYVENIIVEEIFPAMSLWLGIIKIPNCAQVGARAIRMNGDI